MILKNSTLNPYSTTVPAMERLVNDSYRFKKILSPSFHNTTLSLRATKGNVAISFSITLYEIASVVLLPRNDIMTQPLRGTDSHITSSPLWGED